MCRGAAVSPGVVPTSDAHAAGRGGWCGPISFTPGTHDASCAPPSPDGSRPASCRCFCRWVSSAWRTRSLSFRTGGHRGHVSSRPAAVCVCAGVRAGLTCAGLDSAVAARRRFPRAPGRGVRPTRARKRRDRAGRLRSLAVRPGQRCVARLAPAPRVRSGRVRIHAAGKLLVPRACSPPSGPFSYARRRTLPIRPPG